MKCIVKIEEVPDGLFFKVLDESNNIKFFKHDFLNYFFVSIEDEFIVKNLLERFIFKTTYTQTSDGKEYLKVQMKNNYDKYKMVRILDENGISHFESDLNSVSRFLINSQGVELHQDRLRKCFYDIETFDLEPLEKDFKGIVKGKDPILSIAFKDFDGNVKYLVNKGLVDEQNFIDLYRNYIETRDRDLKKQIQEQMPEMLKKLLLGEKQLLLDIKSFLMNKYDLLLAWRGDVFDEPYLNDRFELHGLNLKDLRTNFIDYYLMYKKNSWTKLKSYSLNAVSEFEFEGEINNPESKFKNLDEVQKIDWREKTKCNKFFELFLLEPELLKEYNIQDVNLMYLIEEKNHFIKIHEVQTKLGHCLLRETLFNSVVGDYMILNESRKRNIVKKSKPNRLEVEARKDPITGIYPSGGFTYCYKPGFHKFIHGFDAKSQYPTNIVSYNISEDTFIEARQPRLELVFNEKEIELIRFAENIRKKHWNAKGLLKKKKYEIEIEAKRAELGVESNMVELMWKFVREYNDEELLKYAKANNISITPADINYDTRGWLVHPHRLFKNDNEGILPYICKYLITERDKTKYELNNVEYHSIDWWEKHIYQNGLKVAANSMFGIHGLKSFRDFNYDITDSITTASRFQTKSVVVFAQDKGYYTTNGDTDGAYLGNEEDSELEPAIKRAKELDKQLFSFFNSYADRFNTNVKIELINPNTGEKELCNHFFVFEHEKTFYSVIVVKKKKYYYKHLKKDKFVYETMGGLSKKSDTIKIAADLQRKLVKDILDEEFNKDLWKKRILDLKKTVYNYDLELEHITNYSSLSKKIEEYGKPTIDGKTGQPKIKKDGSIQYAPVPAHVLVAKRMIESGEDISVGDKIPYIIVESKPRNVGASLKEYLDGAKYDLDYYWTRIITPLLEILLVVYPEDVYTYFKECWGFKDSVLKNKIKKLEEENDEEDDYEDE